MKNKKQWIIGGGIGLLLALFVGCGEHAGEKEYHRAMASWQAGDLVRAQGQLEKAMRKLSGNEIRSVANNQLGLILWGLGKQDQAVKKFEESCRLATALNGANLNLGIARYYAGQLEQAKFELTKILSEQPADPTAQAFMSLILMQEKEWQAASRELTAGLRKNPNNPAGQNALALAELHLGGGRDAAMKRLTQLTITYPNYAPAFFNIAVIQDQWLKKPQAALSKYKTYLAKAAPDAPQRKTAQNAIARLEGKPMRTTASSSPQSAEQWIAAGSRLQAAQKYPAAITQYQKAIQADPTQKTAHYNMGLSYYALKNYPQAVQACSRALTIDPRFADARYMLSLSYSQQRKWNEAEREAKALKSVDPKRSASMLNYIEQARKR